MPTATDIVRLLTCVQSQECAHAFWSLGMRSSAVTMAEVQAEFDAGRFLRTHILRPTWHLVPVVPAEDIRWILKVTSARVQQVNSTIYRRENLDPAVLDRGAELITQVLRGRRYQTRGRDRRCSGRRRAECGSPATGLCDHERRTRRSDLQRADAGRTAHLCAAGRAGAVSRTEGRWPAGTRPPIPRWARTCQRCGFRQVGLTDLRSGSRRCGRCGRRAGGRRGRRRAPLV